MKNFQSFGDLSDPEKIKNDTQRCKQSMEMIKAYKMISYR